MTMKTSVMLVGLLALLLMAGPSSAAIVIDFEQGSVEGGTITYAGGVATGVNIPVDLLKVTDGATITYYDLFGAGASSQTDIIEGNANGSALVNFNTSTGAFTIVGGVCPLNSGSIGCPTPNSLVDLSTLVNGTAASATIVAMDASHLTLVEADTKGQALLSALGLPLNTQFDLATAQFNNFTLVPGATNSWAVGSVDIANVGVPEPASILLLGMTVFGVTGLIRRRASKA
jgi:hypothetical protein